MGRWPLFIPVYRLHPGRRQRRHALGRLDRRVRCIARRHAQHLRHRHHHFHLLFQTRISETRRYDSLWRIRCPLSHRQSRNILLEFEDSTQRDSSHAQACQSLILDIHRLSLRCGRVADSRSTHLPLEIKPRFLRRLWLYLPRRRLLLPLRHVPS